MEEIMEVTIEEYRAMDRYEKARFLWRDVYEPVEVGEARKWVTAFLLNHDEITAGEVAEAILLGDPHACYLYRGRIPESHIDDNWKARSRDVVDRAMRMADSWYDDAYQDCFSHLYCYYRDDYELPYVLLFIETSPKRLYESLKDSGYPQGQVAAIVAGGIAAQEAERVLEFLAMTEQVAAETTPQLAVIS